MSARRLHPRRDRGLLGRRAARAPAFPLVLIVGVNLLGGRLSTPRAWCGRRSTAAIGARDLGGQRDTCAGARRRYWVDGDVIHHRTGLLRVRETHVPLGRVDALDVHQGPLQRLFGVQAVDVQTGAGGKGGEISLPALSRTRSRELRAGGPAAARRGRGAPAGPARAICGPRAAAIAALTAGPARDHAAGPGGARADRPAGVEDERGRARRVRLLPHTVAAGGRGRGRAAARRSRGCSRRSARSSRSPASRVRATATGCGSAAGSSRAREATVPVGRVRAVRVVEGLFRRAVRARGADGRGDRLRRRGRPPPARCSRSCALRDVRAFLDELLPELADDPRGLARPPARAARRYLMLADRSARLVLRAAAWFLVGPFAAAALAAGRWRTAGRRWRAAGWRLRDGRLAVRSLRLARDTVLAPARCRESHTVRAERVPAPRARLRRPRTSRSARHGARAILADGSSAVGRARAHDRRRRARRESASIRHTRPGRSTRPARGSPPPSRSSRGRVSPSR